MLRVPVDWLEEDKATEEEQPTLDYNCEYFRDPRPTSHNNNEKTQKKEEDEKKRRCARGYFLIETEKGSGCNF